MKRILFIVVFVTGLSGYAQVGVGTSNPDNSAQLDVVSTNKGILIPRVKLTGSLDLSTIANPKESLLVYNTQTVSDVVPGFYYWNSSKWVALSGDGLSGTVGIANGGTGAVTAAAALANLGAQSAANLTTTLGATADHYPSESAVRLYVDAETARATTTETALQSGIDAKASAADVAIAVAFETTRATTAETNLQAAVDAKASAADIASAVATETTRATAAEAALQSAVDLKATAADITSAVASETTRARFIESALQTAVDLKATAADLATETSRATTAEAALQSAVDLKATAADLATETTRATAAEAALQSAVDLKATAADLATETTRATAAETALQTDINTITTAVAAETARATTVEALKEVLVNKSNVIDAQTDDTKYPSVKAVKTYVDAMPSFYGADGTLSSARTVNQNNNDLTFTTGTGKLNVNGTTFHNGAVVVKTVRTTDANYAVLPDDYAVFYDGATPGTFNLGGGPVGRIVLIVNGTGSDLAITPRKSGFTSAYVGGGFSMFWIFDGTVWNPLNQ